MTAVRAGDVGRVLASLPGNTDLLLIYGPDAGLVAERAAGAASAFVTDPADQFQLIRLDGDAIADNPERLVEEATTFGLFGGKRAIRVRPTSRNITPSVTACLQVALMDTLVVLEAGDLNKASPLRVAVESSPRALALPCYPDEEVGLEKLAGDGLRQDGFTIDAETLELLVESLGGDRMATRSELEKLRLYAHGRPTITRNDIEAVVSDASGSGLDEVLGAAFSGKTSELDAATLSLFQRAGSSGVLPLALRHALSLLSSRDRLDRGDDIDSALRSWRGLNRDRRQSVTGQLRTWSVSRLVGTVEDLQAALFETRRSPQLSEVIVHRTLLRISERARQATEARSRLHSPSS